MSLLDDAKIAVLNYGRNGDDSFECLGIDLNKNGISNVKTYRYYKSRKNTVVDWCNELGHPFSELIKRFEERKIIRFQEMSKSKNSAKNQYKMYFSVKCNIPFEQHFQETELFFREIGYNTYGPIRDIERCISSHLSPGRSPLLMLGMEMDDDSVKMLKAHLSLERFAHYSQRFGEKLFFDDLEDTISDVTKLVLSLSELENEYVRVGRVASKYHFYPFMIGINQSYQQMEYKLYFRIRYNGLTNEQIYDNTFDMIQCMEKHVNIEQFKKTLRDFFEIGLFMEGFAFGYKDGHFPTVKTYFFPLPKSKI